jgi:hypothetical protein
MLKSFLLSATLAATTAVGFYFPSSAAAEGEACVPSCTGSCGRGRPCEYRAKELAVTNPALPTATPEAPVQMVDPPAVETPQPPIETPAAPSGRGNRRGRGIRGRG